MTDEHAGRMQPSAYTPPTMDSGTLGERQRPDVDELYAEAESLLSRSANELRGITERLRQAYAAMAPASETDGIRPRRRR